TLEKEIFVQQRVVKRDIALGDGSTICSAKEVCLKLKFQIPGHLPTVVVETFAVIEMGVTDTPLIMGYPAIKEKDLVSLMTASPLPPPDEIMAIEEGKASGEIAKHLKTRVLPLLEEYRSKIKSRGSIPASVEPFSIRLVPGEKFVLSSGRRINHA
ncbi:hypothetical protein ADUPG1_002612, partial [Aduncisulcus paluster]